MALKLELFTRVAWNAGGRPIRVFRAKSWESMKRRIARFFKDHDKSTGGSCVESSPGVEGIKRVSVRPLSSTSFLQRTEGN